MFKVIVCCMSDKEYEEQKRKEAQQAKSSQDQEDEIREKAKQAKKVEMGKETPAQIKQRLMLEKKAREAEFLEAQRLKKLEMELKEKEERNRKGKGKATDEEPELVELLSIDDIIKIDVATDGDVDLSDFIQNIRKCCVRGGYEIVLNKLDGNNIQRQIKMTCPPDVGPRFGVVFAGGESGTLTVLMRRHNFYILAFAETDASMSDDFRNPESWYVLLGTNLRFEGSSKGLPTHVNFGISYTDHFGYRISPDFVYKASVGKCAMRKQIKTILNYSHHSYEELYTALRNLLLQSVEMARLLPIFELVIGHWGNNEIGVPEDMLESILI